MAKSKKRGRSPQHIPVSQAELRHATIKAMDDAIEFMGVVFLSVLKDKEGYSARDLQRVWREIDERCECIDNGYCTVADLKNALKVEDGLIIAFSESPKCGM